MTCLAALVLPHGMTMLPLNQRQRELLADKLSDVANLAAAALIFGQFLGEQPFSLLLASIGVGIWAIVTTCAVALIRRRAL